MRYVQSGVSRSLYPTIFKMLVDAILRHWVTLVEEEESRPDGFGQAVKTMASLFYADKFLLPSTRIERLQHAFYALTDIFDRVGL